MQSKEVQQMLTIIIEHAQTKPHIEFKFLTNWSEYKYQRGKRKYLKLLLRALNSGANRLFKNYCKSLLASNSSITKLLAFNQLRQVYKYYEEELQIVNEMICEYEAYLLDGNYLWSFLGAARAAKDMRDFRE